MNPFENSEKFFEFLRKRDLQFGPIGNLSKKRGKNEKKFLLFKRK